MPTREQLSDRFRSFARTTTRAPLYRDLADAIASDEDLLDLLDGASDEQALPVLLFAAVHSLVLEHTDSELARHYPTVHEPADSGSPRRAFRRFALDHADEIREIVARRRTQTNEVGRCALFLPALAAVAAECGTLALIDVGASAGLNLLLADYHYVYETESDSVHVGAPSPVVLQCSVRGPAPLPHAIPSIGSSVGLDADPIDVHDEESCRWLEACVWPDQLDRFRRLVAALEMARRTPPDVRPGDAVVDLAALISEARGHPVVMNSWVLNYLCEADRRAYVAELDSIGEHTDLSWIIAESPAETPGLPVPTTEPPEQVTVLSLVRWRGGHRDVRRLATCHPHGYWMHWEWPLPG